MKKLIALIALTTCLTACAESRTINGTTYTPYGLFNQDKADPEVVYEVSGGNIFWGFVWVETIIAPIYFFGFALYEPTGPKHNK